MLFSLVNVDEGILVIPIMIDYLVDGLGDIEVEEFLLERTAILQIVRARNLRVAGLLHILRLVRKRFADLAQVRAYLEEHQAQIVFVVSKDEAPVLIGNGTEHYDVRSVDVF